MRTWEHPENMNPKCESLLRHADQWRCSLTNKGSPNPTARTAFRGLCFCLQHPAPGSRLRKLREQVWRPRMGICAQLGGLGLAWLPPRCPESSGQESGLVSQLDFPVQNPGEHCHIPWCWSSTFLTHQPWTHTHTQSASSNLDQLTILQLPLRCWLLLPKHLTPLFPGWQTPFHRYTFWTQVPTQACLLNSRQLTVLSCLTLLVRSILFAGRHVKVSL